MYRVTEFSVLGRRSQIKEVPIVQAPIVSNRKKRAKMYSLSQVYSHCCTTDDRGEAGYMMRVSQFARNRKRQLSRMQSYEEKVLHKMKVDKDIVESRKRAAMDVLFFSNCYEDLPLYMGDPVHFFMSNGGGTNGDWQAQWNIIHDIWLKTLIISEERLAMFRSMESCAHQLKRTMWLAVAMQFVLQPIMSSSFQHKDASVKDCVHQFLVRLHLIFSTRFMVTFAEQVIKKETASHGSCNGCSCMGNPSNSLSLNRMGNCAYAEDHPVHNCFHYTLSQPQAPEKAQHAGDPFIGDQFVGDSFIGDLFTGDPFIGESTVGESTVGESAIGESAIGESAIGESAIGRGSTDGKGIYRRSMSCMWCFPCLNIYSVDDILNTFGDGKMLLKMGNHVERITTSTQCMVHVQDDSDCRKRRWDCLDVVGRGCCFFSSVHEEISWLHGLDVEEDIEKQWAIWTNEDEYSKHMFLGD